MATFRKKTTRKPIKQEQETHRINELITAREVRVVDEAGEQLGVLSIRDALQRAEDSGVDLVEVAPLAKPPVCRLMDYGKFKYREQKKEAEARKKRSEITTKELRIRYRTDSGDLETKLKHAREFLLEGDKVKFSMRFRGREIMYTQLGLEKFQEISDNLADVATIDEQSPTGGRQIYIVFAPTKEAVAKAQQQKAQQEKEQAKKTKQQSSSTAGETQSDSQS